jgi:hypothetical protein
MVSECERDVAEFGSSAAKKQIEVSQQMIAAGALVIEEPYEVLDAAALADSVYRAMLSLKHQKSSPSFGLRLPDRTF